LDYETALRYLRKEALQNLPPELPKGIVRVTYQHHPLGFIKNIGNRANNLYPQEWRIRMR
jgi:NOL1/NOP2/fmu family ribosome biogenesis protein